MAEPAAADVEALQSCNRFLLKYARCIQSFERQEIVPKQITCFRDSEFAGYLHAEQEEYEFLHFFEW